MRKRIGIALLLCCLLLLFTSGCSGISEAQKSQSSPAANITEVGTQSAAETAIQIAGEENKYLFLIFYKQGDSKSEEMKQVADQAQKEIAEKANVVYIDSSDDSEQALMRKIGIDESIVPITVVIAPNGAIVIGFAQEVSIQDLQNSFVSPKMAEILKTMQDGKLVFLYVANPGMEYYEENLTTIQETAEGDFPDSSRIVEVDPGDAGASDVIKRCKIEVPVSETNLLILNGGYIMGTLAGKIDKQALLEASTAACSGGSCCPTAE